MSTKLRVGIVGLGGNGGRFLDGVRDKFTGRGRRRL